MNYREIAAASALPIVVVAGMTLLLPGFMTPAGKYAIPLAVASVLWMALAAFISTRIAAQSQRWVLLGLFSVILTAVLAASPLVATITTSY